MEYKESTFLEILQQKVPFVTIPILVSLKKMI